MAPGHFPPVGRSAGPTVHDGLMFTRLPAQCNQLCGVACTFSNHNFGAALGWLYQSHPVCINFGTEWVTYYIHVPSN